MPRAVGSKSAVVATQEALWGNLNASPTSVLGFYIRSFSLGGTKGTFQSETINQHRAIVGLTDGNKAVQGNMVSDLLPEGLEVLLRHLLGKGTVATTGSGPYTHVLKGSPETLEGLSFQKSFTNISKHFLYTGVHLNSMAIDIVQEGFHAVTWDFVGKCETIFATEQISIAGGVFPTKNGFNGYQASIEIDTGSGYTALGRVVSGSLNIANNVETDGYVLGSADRASCEYGTRECSGGFAMFFEDTTLYELYIAGTECDLKYVFSNALTGDSITFEFPKVKLAGSSPEIASAAGVNLDFTFQARVDPGEDTDVIVTIVNSLASIELQSGEV
jgi:hypothetical protein